MFGYGNDQDSNYHTLKALEINEFLKHLKTFEYGVNDNYQRVYSELLGIKGEFEVHVLGHSLSNTDKTLLQEIMDSDECFRINFYKRSDLEPKEQLLAYKELYYAASRIVEDERTIRKKIVPFNNSEIFASKDT